MKKIFVLIACLALVLFTAGAVSAASSATPLSVPVSQSLTTNVTYSVTGGYELIVPADFAVTEEARVFSVTISNAVIADTEMITVTVFSTQFEGDVADGNGNYGLWTLKSTTDQKLHYHIHRIDSQGGETPVKNNGVVFSATGGDFAAANIGNVQTHSITQMVELHLHSEEVYAGSYSDRLTFTSHVLPIPTP